MSDAAQKNIMIPLQLLIDAIELLEYIDVTCYDWVIKSEYDSILYELRKKRCKVDLRKAYGEIVFAGGEDDRTAARIRYLQKKRAIADSAFF